MHETIHFLDAHENPKIIQEELLLKKYQNSDSIQITRKDLVDKLIDIYNFVLYTEKNAYTAQLKFINENNSNKTLAATARKIKRELKKIKEDEDYNNCIDDPYLFLPYHL